jgi:hypothetical protein
MRVFEMAGVKLLSSTLLAAVLFAAGCSEKPTQVDTPEQPVQPRTEVEANELNEQAETDEESEPREEAQEHHQDDEPRVSWRAVRLEDLGPSPTELEPGDRIEVEPAEHWPDPDAEREQIKATVSGTVVNTYGFAVPGARVHGQLHGWFEVDYKTEAGARVIRVERIFSPVLATTDLNGAFVIEIDRETIKDQDLLLKLHATAPGQPDSETDTLIIRNGDHRANIRLVLGGPGGATSHR